MLDHCIYVSVANVPSRSIHEGQIFLEARNFNSQFDITGYLHREDGFYAQYIEGPAPHLEKLVHMILGDWRHRDMRILTRGHRTSRLFAGWDMAFTDDETSSFRTFQTAARRPSAIDQASVGELLLFMEHTAGSGDALGVEDMVRRRKVSA